MSAKTRLSARETIFANASSLLEEADLLFEKGRYSRASALAILSIEESGKCKLLEIAAEKAEKVDSSSEFHAKKQAIIASYEKGRIFYEIIMQFCEEHGAQLKHVSELSETQRKFLDSEANKEFQAFFEDYVTEKGSELLENQWKVSRFHRGEYRRIKNASLYVDVDEKGTVISTPGDITRSDAVEIIEQARSALNIAQPKDG